MKRIVILIPYFGRWPEWLPLYLESCRANPSIDWVFYSDCPAPVDSPPNVTFRSISFEDYCRQVSDKLGIDFSPTEAYKLCDIRPAIGDIHEDDIEGYDYFGYGDIDVIYGDIRAFYTEEVLRYTCISTHRNRLSGHFSLLKNTPLVRSAYRKMPQWRELMANKEYQRLDEAKFSKVFLRHKKHPQWLRRLYHLFDPLQGDGYFKEQYSTILSPIPWLDGSMEHPQVWFWRNGKLTNDHDGERGFLYLHFMNWKSATWLKKFRGEKAAWQDLRVLNHVPSGQERNGFRIDREGFHPLQESNDS